jgi:peroxiredoxin
MTSGSARKHTEAQVAAHLAQVRAEQAAEERRRRRRVGGLWTIAILVLIGVVTFGLLSSRSATTASASTAPDFTLSTTAGQQVTLSALRGTPVLLYFNEGAGCGSCTQQMAAIEKDPAFAAAGVKVLPVVMNTAAQITPDLIRYGVKSPYLLDDGTISKAYDALGKGMHEGLPGHGFVFIDKAGVQRWQGNYPSMWLAPTELMATIKPYL